MAIMFDKNFIKEEVKCDFLIEEKRKKIWYVQLDLYKKIREVSEKYGLNLIVIGGTALGAVRHKGYIPWDDDLDVALTRDDFEKLVLVSEKEFNDPYFFQYALSDKLIFCPWARLRRSDTTGIVRTQCNHKYNNGIFVDIFIFDKIPEDKGELKRFTKKIALYQHLLRNYYHYNSTNKKLESIKRIVFPMTKHFITYEKLYEKYVKLCSKYNKTDEKKYADLCALSLLGKTDLSEDDFLESIEVPFENTTVKIPKNYDERLKSQYGDYMSFPPVKDRGQWHDNVILFDPDIPFIEYYKNHKTEFAEAAEEYGLK